MKTITIPNWHQIDIPLRGETLHGAVKTTLTILKQVADSLKCEHLFFLFEGKYIRVRVKMSDTIKFRETIIKYFGDDPPLGEVMPYVEEKWKFGSWRVAELFAIQQSAITTLVLEKNDGDIDYNPYRIYERICHCVYNQLYGHVGNEAAILMDRLMERQQLDDKKYRKTIYDQ